MLLSPNELIAFDNQFYVSSIGVHRRWNGRGYKTTYPTRQVSEQNLTIFYPTEPSLSREIEETIYSKSEIWVYKYQKNVTER